MIIILNFPKYELSLPFTSKDNRKKTVEGLTLIQRSLGVQTCTFLEDFMQGQMTKYRETYLIMLIPLNKCTFKMHTRLR